MRRTLACLGYLTLLVVATSLAARAADDPQPTNTDSEAKEAPLNWNRARELHQRVQQGEKLNDEDQAYYNRALAARRAGQTPRTRPTSTTPSESTGGESTELTPLTDLSSGKYKGQSGGLYGEGRNTPPEDHLQAALELSAAIQPLNAEGQPDASGKIVMISNGMSNTTQEFSAFVQMARADKSLNDRLVIVDGAQGGQEASDWARPSMRERQERGQKQNPWDVLDRRLEQAGVSPQQVQVLWVKQARRNPATLGEFPAHAQAMQEDLVVVLNKMREKFPNLKLAYLSSRTYGGYARGGLNPEPYAYEGAFAVRWLIDAQRAGESQLNYDAMRGEVNAPLLLWGPYLWANGVEGRATDDLVYERADFGPDGTHPSESGRRKVAEQLMAFFKSNPTSRPWFTGR